MTRDEIIRKAAEQALGLLGDAERYLRVERIYPIMADDMAECAEILRAALAAPERKPLSLDQIEDLESRAYAATTEKGAPLFVYALRLVRSVEKAHGIAESKP